MTLCVRFVFVLGTALLLTGCNPLIKVAKENPDSIVHGYTAPGFEKVREVFINNFIEYNERGAGLTVYYGDTVVVELYGGYSQRLKSPFGKETLIQFFSAAKGIAALVTACAVSDGLFGYEDTIARYWPGFAQNCKESITVEQLLSHQAGLPLVDARVRSRYYADTSYILEALEQQFPFWEPGTQQGYHPFTTGLYLNELFKKTDNSGRGIDRYFYDRITRPLGLEFYFGLPDTVSRARVARMYDITSVRYMSRFFDIPKATRLKIYNPRSIINKIFRILVFFKPNSEAYRSALIPAINGLGRVSDVARLYWIFAGGAPELQLRSEILDALKAPAHQMPGNNVDVVLGIPMYYKSGFRKPSPDSRFGSSQTTFGMSGAGGSFAFADPDIRLGYCYAATLMRGYTFDDPREVALREAVYECVRAIERDSD